MAKEKFDIPSQSIVKAAPAEGSADWMKRISKEHGDTAPQKLEKRREKLSVFAKLQEDNYKNLQIQKKQYIVHNQKMEADLLKQLTALTKATPEHTNIENQISMVRRARQDQEQAFSLLISQSMYQSASIEALCLIVDSLTLRETAKSKSGKVGMLRFSNCLYALDSAYYSEKGYNRLRKLFDLFAAAFPAAVATLKEDEDEEQEDPSEYEDDDVMTEEDRQKVKKELEGETEL